MAKLQGSCRNITRNIGKLCNNAPIFNIVSSGVRIRPRTSEDYIAIFDQLLRRKIEYYHSPLKYIKVVVRDLPVDTPTDDIKDELI